MAHFLDSRSLDAILLTRNVLNSPGFKGDSNRDSFHQQVGRAKVKQRTIAPVQLKINSRLLEETGNL